MEPKWARKQRNFGNFALLILSHFSLSSPTPPPPKVQTLSNENQFISTPPDQHSQAAKRKQVSGEARIQTAEFNIFSFIAASKALMRIKLDKVGEEAP
ncbi:hypothetical protein P7K49_016818, partial [Saguinus oedipus]